MFQPTGSPVQWGTVLVLIGIITELSSAAWPGDQQAFYLCSRLEQRRDKGRWHGKLFTTRPIKISNVCQTKSTGVSLSNIVHCVPLGLDGWWFQIDEALYTLLSSPQGNVCLHKTSPCTDLMQIIFWHLGNNARMMTLERKVTGCILDGRGFGQSCHVWNVHGVQPASVHKNSRFQFTSSLVLRSKRHWKILCSEMS